MLVRFTLPFLLPLGLIVWLRSRSRSLSRRLLLLLDDPPGLSRAAAPPTMVVVVCGMKTCSKFMVVFTGRLPLPLRSWCSREFPLLVRWSSGVTVRMVVCVPLLFTAVLPEPCLSGMEGRRLTDLGLGSVCVELVDMVVVGWRSVRYSSYMLGSLDCFSCPHLFLLRDLSWSCTLDCHTPLRRREDLSLMFDRRGGGGDSSSRPKSPFQRAQRLVSTSSTRCS